MAEFEWDKAKAARNIKKHGLRFKVAVRIFDGITLTAEDDRKDYGETREVSIGTLAEDIIAVVVHTKRQGRKRIISARLANSKERRAYHEYCAKKAG